MKNRPDAFAGQADARLEEAIRGLFTKLADGFNKNDPSMLDDGFCDDAVLIAPDGTLVQGWRNLLEYHTARLSGQAKDWHTAFSVLSIGILTEDSAVVHTRQDTKMPDGGFSNHGTYVLVKRNGRWWICSGQSTKVMTLPSDK